MVPEEIQLTNLELFTSVNRLLAEAEKLREIRAKLFKLAGDYHLAAIQKVTTHTLDAITKDMDTRTKKGIWRAIAKKKGVDRPTGDQVRAIGREAVIDDLLALSGMDLLATSNFGHASLRKLKDTLAAKGLSLAGD